MHLMDALLGEADACADAGEGHWGLVAQAIVGHDKGTEVVGEAGHQVTQSGLDGRGLRGADRIGVLTGARGWGQDEGWRPVCGFDGTPDGMSDTGPGIGGEGQATLRVEAQDGVPQADAPSVQGIGKGQPAEHLLADDGMNQAVVLGHEVVEAVGASRLSAAAEGGRGPTIRNNVGQDRYRHKAPPSTIETP